MEREQILDIYYEHKMHWKSVNRERVLAAMDEYAKQEAIGFAKFATDVALGKIDVPFKNDTELYQQYLNSKPNATK